jgi:hypothetical protein
MNHLLKLKAMGLLMLLFTMGYVHAQTVAPTRGDGLDNPQIATGQYDEYKTNWVQQNPKEYSQLMSGDKVKENQAAGIATWSTPEEKERWINENPREYARLMEAQKDVKAQPRPTMTRAEFNALPAGRQQAIINEPNTLIIDNTK